jgi:hypothetical protein
MVVNLKDFATEWETTTDDKIRTSPFYYNGNIIVTGAALYKIY